jgi:hypothetical protein
MKKIILLITFPSLIHSQSVNEVWKYVYDQKIAHHEIVVAQSILETGWYKCTQCSLDHNNLFGFRYKGEYIKFDHWKESVDYYKVWQRKHYKGGDYYEFLSCVPFSGGKCYPYAENMQSYITKIEQVLFRIWSC